MYIEKININNFRIYYGENCIELSHSPGKNVTVISGDNGHGKTTLLTALVWCLYGKQMQEVDKFYKDRILAAGGYKKYLESCMNRLAKSRGQTDFSVTIYIRDVTLPGVESCSMQIKRFCNIMNGNDSVQIEIDGIENELVDDFGKQVFIQDFILPKEIAKFFFFDAERIVSIAELQTEQEKKLLSQAYTEVLGIKKYEDLRKNLNDLRIRFKRESANEKEKLEFRDLGIDINRLERSIRQKESRKERLIADKAELKVRSDEFQDKLLREGTSLTLEDIRALQEDKIRLYEHSKTLMSEFRELFELAPFAIASRLIMQVKRQLDVEVKQKESLIDRKLLTEKIDKIVNSLKDDMSDAPQQIDDRIRDYYVSKVEILLKKYLSEEEEDLPQQSVYILHDFTHEQINSFDAIVLNLRNTFRSKLHSLHRSLRVNKAEYSEVSRKLSWAESAEADALVSSYRNERNKLEQRIQSREDEILEITQEIGALQNAVSSKKKSFESLAEKIKVNKQYQDKDELAARLIFELDTFIGNMKLEKKASLEQRILSALAILMHKKDFIQEVTVEIDADVLDICLKDRTGNEIAKDDLSRGEQQLYATAILKAMVEESGIDFPIFIDSPLQKFDDKHSRSIITGFYPLVGKQVVLLPLLGKELTKEEYSLLMDHVKSTFIINNLNENASEFKRVDPDELFKENSRLSVETANV